MTTFSAALFSDYYQPDTGVIIVNVSGVSTSGVGACQYICQPRDCDQPAARPTRGGAPAGLYLRNHAGGNLDLSGHVAFLLYNISNVCTTSQFKGYLLQLWN